MMTQDMLPYYLQHLSPDVFFTYIWPWAMLTYGPSALLGFLFALFINRRLLAPVALICLIGCFLRPELTSNVAAFMVGCGIPLLVFGLIGRLITIFIRRSRLEAPSSPPRRRAWAYVEPVSLLQRNNLVVRGIRYKRTEKKDP
jgi:hypothetical protein